MRCCPRQPALADARRVQRLSPHSLHKRPQGQGCRAGKADVGLKAAQWITREQGIRTYRDNRGVRMRLTAARGPGPVTIERQNHIGVLEIKFRPPWLVQTMAVWEVHMRCTTV